MNLDPLIVFSNEATEEVAKYMVSMTLSPTKMIAEEFAIHSLTWYSICYGKEELEKVPDDKRGVYAFAISHESAVLPPHEYILYIGIAGYNSQRSLRERYKDYLNAKKVIKRAKIARMIGTWHEVLRFFFAPVDGNVSNNDLKTIEQQLNTALMPPFSEKDLEASLKHKRRAFSR